MENEPTSKIIDEENGGAHSIDEPTTEPCENVKNELSKAEKVECEVNEVREHNSDDQMSSEPIVNVRDSKLDVNESIEESNEPLKNANNEIESKSQEKVDDLSETTCEPDSAASVLLADGVSDQIVLDQDAPLDSIDGVEEKNTDGDIPMECVIDSSPEKSVRCVDSEMSENEPLTFNLNSSPIRSERFHRQRSISVSSTEGDGRADSKANEIFDLIDDDDDENLDDSDCRNQSKSGRFEDDIESDTFENSSEEDDAESMSDEENIDDDYDSDEPIHSIDDSDDEEEIAASGDVRKHTHTHYHMSSNL